MAESVMERLELDAYESGLVVSLITNHLEMSAALRRDIFDEETVRAFAGKVHTPEALRMLTLFTYADINAVHPDALTPWKAENLWQLSIARKQLQEIRTMSRQSTRNIAWDKPMTMPVLTLVAMMVLTCVGMAWKW